MDTSAFLAGLDRRDQWHHPAAQGFRQLARERRPLVTTNLVVAEVYSLALRSLGLRLARQWLEEDLSGIPVFFQREEHHPRVRELLHRSQTPGLSYVDALSFVAMEEIGTSVAFTFDHDFQQYGWTLYPAPLG